MHQQARVCFRLWLMLIILVLTSHSVIDQATNPMVVQDGWFTTSDSVHLHYLVAGQGPSITFIPGWMMPADIFDAQIKSLAATHRVMAVDPRAQGKSEDTPEGLYPERRARDVYELVQHLALDPVVLVGWSLGVPEVLSYVEQFGTSTIRAIVLVDGPIVAKGPKVENGWRLLLGQLQRNRQEFEKWFIKVLFNTPPSDSFVNRVADGISRSRTNSAFVILGSHLIANRDWRDVLARVDCPVLIVTSPMWSDQAELVRAALPTSKIELFSEAGHALFADEPERFNKLLQDLFDNK